MQPEDTAVPNSSPTLTAGALSVVVPCCNEADALPALFPRLERLAAATPVEFVFVDDGSTDTTAALLEAYCTRSGGAARLIRHPHNRGITQATLSGARAARGALVATLDADGSYDPMLLLDMLPLLTPEVAVVTASPYHPRGAVTGVPPWRLALSKLASRLYAGVMHNRLYCYTSCFRIYRRDALLDTNPARGDFVGVAEVLWHIDRSGARIAECPATLGVRSHGVSKMRVLRTAIRHVGLLTQILRERRAPPSRIASA